MAVEVIHYYIKNDRYFYQIGKFSIFERVINIAVAKGLRAKYKKAKS